MWQEVLVTGSALPSTYKVCLLLVLSQLCVSGYIGCVDRLMILSLSRVPRPFDSMASQEAVEREPLSVGGPGDNGDFSQAIERLSDALNLNPRNVTLYSNRAAAYMRVCKYSEALDDANRALELKPEWAKGFYRLGAALVGLERYTDALEAFARGLASDSKQVALVDALIETMLKSPFKDTFEPKLVKFRKLKLDRNPFIVTSMVGQELLSAMHYDKAVTVLEAAKRIGTDSEKLEASLHQALGQAYWNMKEVRQALEYMRSDLALNNKLADNAGVCRAHDNLGIALSSLGKYPEAIEHHNIQQGLARRTENSGEVYRALNRLARIYTKMGKPQQAVLHYKEAWKAAKPSQDQATMMECMMNIGSTYTALNEMDKAIQWHQRHLQLAQQAHNREQQAEVYASLGQAYFKKNCYDQAMMFYQQLLSLAVNMGNASLKARAYGGMGRANLAMGNLWYAQMCREHQLKLARELPDADLEAEALHQLGNVHKSSGKVSQAMQYYQDSLTIVKQLGNRAAEGTMYTDIGSCYVAMGNLREAVKYYQLQLDICTELNDPGVQAATEGQLGMAHLDLGNLEVAFTHLSSSLEQAEALMSQPLQCQAHTNLGQYFRKCREYHKALTHLDKAHQLASELKDHMLESTICHHLGLCHDALGNHRQAIHFFTNDLMVAKETKDKEGVSKACDRLINAYLEIGDREQAEVYKLQLVNIAKDFDHTSNKCALLNKMAEDMLHGGECDKAVEFFEQLLKEAEKDQHQSFKGQAYCGLGNTYMALGKPDRALSYYQQDLTVCKGTSNLTGECQAYANMGSAYNTLGQHQEALRCYMANLELAHQLDNPALTAKSLSAIGIVHRNMGNFEDALHYHQQQLTVAQSLAENYHEQALAHRNLGESREAMGEHMQAIQSLMQYLHLVQKTKDMAGQVQAHSSLGRVHRSLGNYQESLQHFANSMKVIKDTADDEAELSCYADMGGVHLKLGNFESAIQAHMRQFELAQDLQDLETQALASSCLGEVYHCSGNYLEAIRYHHQDLNFSRRLQSGLGQVRSFGNLAKAYEAMEEYDKAIDHWENQAALASNLRDDLNKAEALTGLGIVNIKMEFYDKAIALLTQAWALVGDRADSVLEIKANILYNLGLAYFNTHNYSRTCASLQRSINFFEELLHSGEMNCHASALVMKYSHLLQVLIHALVHQKKVAEALEIAERERNRQVVELMQHRNISLRTMYASGILRDRCLSAQAIQDAVISTHTPVVYYCIALGHLFIWLIHPQGGVVQFKQCDLSSLELNLSDSGSILSHSSNSVTPLEDKISELREGLGLPRQVFSAPSASASMTSEDGTEWEEDTVSLESSSNDFMTLAGKDSSRCGSVESSDRRSTSSSVHRTRSTYSPPNLQPLQDLYNILIRPLETALPKPRGSSHNCGPLIIIPDKDLFLIPFSLLRSDPNSPCLHQRFQLSVSLSAHCLATGGPSLETGRSRLSSDGSHGSGSSSPNTKSRQSIPITRSRHATPTSLEASTSSALFHSGGGSSPERSQKAQSLVVGNPTLPNNVTILEPGIMFGSEREAKVVAEMLDTQPLTGGAASKDKVLKRMPSARCVHFATGLSWNQSMVVLAPRGDVGSGREQEVERRDGDGHGYGHRGEADGAASGTPEPEDYLLSAKDILHTRLSANLVTISGCHRTNDPYLTTGGIISVAASFLAAGAQSVLVPLWPTSNQASRLMMSAFYSSLLCGSRASRALGYAMQTVSKNKKYSHPIHWAGYMLVGRDSLFKDRMVEMAASLRNMMHASEDYLIAALKTIQGMVVSSLSRVQDDISDPKCTPEQALEQKIGPVPGWKELLKSVGFHFIGQIGRDVPSTIIFPEHDDSNMLRKCKRCIDAVLSLPSGGLVALQQLARQPTAGPTILAALHKACQSSETGDAFFSTHIDCSTWMLKGCQNFFTALHFKAKPDSAQVVSLSIPNPARDHRQLVELAMDAMTAVFGPEEHMEQPPVLIKDHKELSALC